MRLLTPEDRSFLQVAFLVPSKRCKERIRVFFFVGRIYLHRNTSRLKGLVLFNTQTRLWIRKSSCMQCGNTRPGCRVRHCLSRTSPSGGAHLLLRYNGVVFSFFYFFEILLYVKLFNRRLIKLISLTIISKL